MNAPTLPTLHVPRAGDDCGPGTGTRFDTWQVIFDPTPSAPKMARALLWADDDGGALSVHRGTDVGQSETYVVAFSGLVAFEISFATKRVVVRPEQDVAASTLHHLLVDQVWPRIIAHRGTLVLHAAGVRTRHGAILVIGPTGHGKSTLSASLHQRGHALLGDDAMIVLNEEGEPHCRAVYPSLRLYPDSISRLFDPAVGQSEVAAYTSKMNVGVGASDDGAGSDPIAALFFLAPDAGSDAPRTERLSPAVACMRMIEHSFWLDPTDQALTVAKLASASALANRVPAFALSYPREFALLPAVHDLMFAALAANASKDPA